MQRTFWALFSSSREKRGSATEPPIRGVAAPPLNHDDDSDGVSVAEEEDHAGGKPLRLDVCCARIASSAPLARAV